MSAFLIVMVIRTNTQAFTSKEKREKRKERERERGRRAFGVHAFYVDLLHGVWYAKILCPGPSQHRVRLACKKEGHAEKNGTVLTVMPNIRSMQNIRAMPAAKHHLDGR